MLRLREQIGALAGTQADVLILGETGAGEVVARALHDLSNRRNGPFVAINAGALAESVVSELPATSPARSPARRNAGSASSSSPTAAPCFSTRSRSEPGCTGQAAALLQERVVERLGGNQSIAPISVSSPQPRKKTCASPPTAASAPTSITGKRRTLVHSFAA